MAAALVQSGIATQTSGTTVTVTLGSTPTLGNLLIFAVGADATTSISSVASNLLVYTFLKSFVFDTSKKINVYGRIATGGENTSHVLTYSGSLNSVGTVLEFSPDTEWLAIGSVLGDTATRDSDDTAIDAPTVGATAYSTLHACFGTQADRGATFSSPTNSYTIAQQAQEGSVVSGFASYKVYTAPSTDETTAVTSDVSAPYGTMHMEFLEVPSYVAQLDAPTGVGASTTHSFTVSSGTDRGLIVGVGTEDLSTPVLGVPTVTYGGQAMTLIVTEVNTSTFPSRSCLFWCNDATIVAASGTTVSVTSNTPASPFPMTIIAFSVQGASQSAPTTTDKDFTDAATPNPLVDCDILPVGDGAYITAHAVVGNSFTATWAGVTEDITEIVGAATITASVGNLAQTTAASVSCDCTWSAGVNRHLVVAMAIEATGAAAIPGGAAMHQYRQMRGG